MNKQMRGFDVLVHEGDARLLAWLTVGAGVPASAYSIFYDVDDAINSVKATPARTPGAGDTVFASEATGELCLTRGSLRDMHLWMSEKGPGDLFMNGQRSKFWYAVQLERFRPDAFVVPPLPDVHEYAFIVSLQNGRLSPPWETWRCLFGERVAWANEWARKKEHDIRGVFEIVVEQPRLGELYESAMRLHEDFLDWYAQTFGPDPVRQLVSAGILPAPLGQKLIEAVAARHGVEVSPIVDDAGYAVTRGRARVDVLPVGARVKAGGIFVSGAELTSGDAHDYAALLVAAAELLDGSKRGTR